jgi:hypothetical protein
MSGSMKGGGGRDFNGEVGKEGERKEDNILVNYKLGSKEKRRKKERNPFNILKGECGEPYLQL